MALCQVILPVPNDLQTSIQENRQPHLSHLECGCVMNMGPEKSKSVLVNGSL